MDGANTEPLTEAPKWGQIAGKWLETRVETVATVLVAIVAAFLGFFGVLQGDQLSSAILAVLVIFAAALTVERERRIGEGSRLDHIEGHIERASDAVRVLASPTPYHVVLSENSWDISGNGDAIGRRLKRLRFSQNEVVAVIDQHRVDGQLANLKYFAGETEIESVHEFPFDGRDCNLVALDRVYMRDEEQDFILERRASGAFPNNPDRSWVAIRESTSLVRLTFRWADRLPSEVRLLRHPPGGSPKLATFSPKPLEDGRVEFETEIPEPERGERLCVEWNW